jgi:hypothetical protein
MSLFLSSAVRYVVDALEPMHSHILTHNYSAIIAETVCLEVKGKKLKKLMLLRKL